MLTLYYAKGTSALAAHILLEEVGAAYQIVEIALADGAHKQEPFLHINPKARVPALETPEGVITENPAILTYVAATHPEAGMLPEGAFARAEADALNAYLCATVHVHMRTSSGVRAGPMILPQSMPWRKMSRQTLRTVRA